LSLQVAVVEVLETVVVVVLEDTEQTFLVKHLAETLLQKTPCNS
jgi:hypothetical protein